VQAAAVVYGSVKGPIGKPPVAGSVSLIPASTLVKTGTVKVAIGRSGTFRVVVRATGSYKTMVRAKFGTRWYAASEVVHIKSGRAYDVSAVLRSEGVFTMFPVGSY
jgi:hypothetical protein